MDSVIIHELCHLKYMNHSKEFYNEVLRVCPNYKQYDRWLKQNGVGIIRRLPRK
jgi:predicted metal-dependent hydrolase